VLKGARSDAVLTVVTRKNDQCESRSVQAGEENLRRLNVVHEFQLVKSEKTAKLVLKSQVVICADRAIFQLLVKSSISAGE
jgi:hypothetical protein